MVNAEDRYVSAAGVDREEEGVVMAKCDRPLRLEWVVDAATSTAVCVEFSDIGEDSVGGTLKSDDLIMVGGIRLDEYSSRLI